MSLDQFAHAAGPWGRSALTALLIFVALWFDPRITYMQRDIIANREYSKAIDDNGTRKSQQEIGAIQAELKDNSRRIQDDEEHYKRIDAGIQAILERLAASKIDGGSKH